MKLGKVRIGILQIIYEAGSQGIRFEEIVDKATVTRQTVSDVCGWFVENGLVIKQRTRCDDGGIGDGRRRNELRYVFCAAIPNQDVFVHHVAEFLTAPERAITGLGSQAFVVGSADDKYTALEDTPEFRAITEKLDELMSAALLKQRKEWYGEKRLLELKEYEDALERFLYWGGCRLKRYVSSTIIKTDSGKFYYLEPSPDYVERDLDWVLWKYRIWDGPRTDDFLTRRARKAGRNGEEISCDAKERSVSRFVKSRASDLGVSEEEVYEVLEVVYDVRKSKPYVDFVKSLDARYVFLYSPKLFADAVKKCLDADWERQKLGPKESEGGGIRSLIPLVSLRSPWEEERKVPRSKDFDSRVRDQTEEA